MEMYELRPDAEGAPGWSPADCRDAKLGLHGKVMVLDRRRVFVGSMNLDPRSHRLNTEDGMLIDSPELARRVAERIEVEFKPGNCWRLGLMDDRRPHLVHVAGGACRKWRRATPASPGGAGSLV